MRFRITLQTADRPGTRIPINYQYPLAAAIYKILDNADEGYARFLHQQGYGKGFKLFTFSQIRCPFRIEGDRFIILGSEISFEIAFHLPDAIQNFIKGLFQTQMIDIADKTSKATFTISSVESRQNRLAHFAAEEPIVMRLRPLSPIVAGYHNEEGRYTFLSPDDKEFSASLAYNWREKIKTVFDEETAASAELSLEVDSRASAARSRLITIKANTPQQTKIRGWMDFGLIVSAERRLIEVLMNCGVGVYNSMGCGMVEVA